MIRKIYQRVFVSLLAVLFLTCIVSPWGAAGWEALRLSHTGMGKRPLPVLPDL